LLLVLISSTLERDSHFICLLSEIIHFSPR
jgi:hypothetical protein